MKPATLVLLAALALAPAGYRPAVAPYTFRFPRDHASHPDTRIEWWYYTGDLKSEARTFGFELTFFRVGLDRTRESSLSAWAPHTLMLAHAALTDVKRGTFVHDEAIAREALGLAGADTSRYRAWIGDWSVELSPDGRTHRLKALAHGLALDLTLEATKPPAVHGRQGVSRKGPNVVDATHYYSITRLAARGRIAAGRDTLAVTGEAWMDHEFGSGSLGRDRVGWDWFGLRLDDGSDLMLYQLRRADGTTVRESSGSLIDTAGRVRMLDHSEFGIEPGGRWKSPHSGGEYPSGWRITVASERLELTLQPALRDQELVTRSTGGVTYWEGLVSIRGTRAGRAVTGKGYVELTGYAGPPPGVPAE